MNTCLLPLFLGNLRGMEWIIIIVVFLLLFGGAATIKKTMRNVGKGVHSFKQGLEEAKAEIRKPIDSVSKTDDTEDGDDTRGVSAKDVKAAAKDTDR